MIAQWRVIYRNAVADTHTVIQAAHIFRQQHMYKLCCFVSTMQSVCEKESSAAMQMLTRLS